MQKNTIALPRISNTLYYGKVPSDTRIKIYKSTDFTTITEQYYQQSESLAKSEREIFVVRHIIHLTIIICTLKGIECHFKLT